MSLAFWSLRIPIAVGMVLFAVLLILLVHRWVDEPRKGELRSQRISELWQERELLRGALSTGTLTHLESTQVIYRVWEIQDELADLGVGLGSLSE